MSEIFKRVFEKFNKPNLQFGIKYLPTKCHLRKHNPIHGKETETKHFIINNDIDSLACPADVIIFETTGEGDWMEELPPASLGCS